MTPIKVLHILNVTVEAPSLSILCDHTDPGEVDLSFITFAGRAGFVESMERRGKDVVALDVKGRKNFPSALKKISRLIKERSPDIVHTHLFEPSLLGLTAAKWHRRKTVLTRHHSDAHHVLPSPLKRSIFLRMEDHINRRADHIIAPSKMVREILLEKENVPAGKVSLIPYGQSFERFASVTPEVAAQKRAELKMDGKLALVCVSRLFGRKGHVYLFEALAPLLKAGLQARLYLVGTGDHEAVLRAKLKELGIENNVEFLGWRDDVLPIIGAADIIVHPSLEDALSQSLIESVMLGKPVVASDISGVRDTLDDGKYGKIVRPADSEAFRAGLEETLADLDAARLAAEKGKTYLLEYMDPDRVAWEHVAIYRALIEN
jgi:glycosyltransferase involved in cell wall biosynthesis